MADQWLEKTGGPAFPCPENIGHTNVDDGEGGTRRLLLMGMTLRDWFAGQALAGMKIPDSGWQIPGASRRRAAEDAYAMADAMLAVGKGGTHD